jgi:hypothetical protein
MNAIMANVDEPSNIKSKLPIDIKTNLDIVFNLSKDMAIDFEYIQRYFCCMLYALDYHSEAEKVLHTIKESELIAAQLLVVVGYKLNEIFDMLNFSANLVAILSTNLKSWLKSVVNISFIFFSSFRLKSKFFCREKWFTFVNF